MARGRKNAEEVIEEVIEEVVEDVIEEKLTTTLVSEYAFLYIAPYNVQFMNGEYEAPNHLVDKLLVYYGVTIK